MVSDDAACQTPPAAFHINLINNRKASSLPEGSGRMQQLSAMAAQSKRPESNLRPFSFGQSACATAPSPASKIP
jgi:hypothetical protein